jgi:hypothetical protein
VSGDADRHVVLVEHDATLDQTLVLLSELFHELIEARRVIRVHNVSDLKKKSIR